MSVSVAALLAEAAARIAAIGPDVDARRDAQVLLGHVLGVSRAWLVAHGADIADPDAAKRLRALVGAREQGQPVAYLTGQREFYGRAFLVSDAVLIPRPDTELLVEAALQRLPANDPRAVLDLGTGSGCIALTLARERPATRVTAIDVSPAALDVARLNAEALQANVEFLQGDWFAAVDGRRFDLIVSNPPYVAEGDPHLACGDVRFEPGQALVAGTDGLSELRRIVASAPTYLNTGGWLLVEHGHDQGEACEDLLRSAGFSDRLRLTDLAGLPRVAGGRLVRESATR